MLHPTLEKVKLYSLYWEDSSRFVAEEEEVENDDPNDEKWPFSELLTSPGSHYKLKHLTMRWGVPHTLTELREILTVFPSLETLEFEFTLDEDRENIDLTRWGAALRELSKNLRCFKLEPCSEYDELAEEWDEGAIGPLRHSMRHLEQLRVPLASLIGTEPAVGGDDLCAYLPESLRWFMTSVAVEGDPEADHRALEKMLWEAGLQGAAGCRCWTGSW